MLSYGFYNYYLLVKENIKSILKNEKFEINKNMNKLVTTTYNYTNKYMDWKHTLRLDLDLDKMNNSQRLLLIANHSNVTDFVHLFYLMSILFPDHKILGVTLKMFGDAGIPYISKELKDYHILLEGNFEKDKIFIEDRINENKNKKTIMLLFPEGTMYRQSDVKKSIDWCKKNNLKMFRETLCPRSKGLYTILSGYKPDCVIQGLLSFKDDPDRVKGNEYYHILENNFPLLCDVELYESNMIDIFNSSNDLEDFEKKLYDYWYDIDDKIVRKYNSIRKLHKTIQENRQLFYDYGHHNNKLLMDIYNYMILIVPFIYYKYGFKTGTVTAILIFLFYKYYVN